MNVTADQFLANLRKKGGSCPHLVVAIGNEEYYQKAIKETLKKRIAFDHKGEELNTWTFEDRFNLVDLREAIYSQSFFGGLNWVIVSDPFVLAKTKDATSDPQTKGKIKKKESPLEAFLELVSDIPATTYVLVQLSAIDKRTSAAKKLGAIAPLVECQPIKWYQTKALMPFLQEQAERYGARFDQGAKALIEDYVAAANEVPLLFLEREIEKIALFAGNRKIWTADDVRQMFSQLPQVSNFALGRAIEERNLTLALELIAAERKNDAKFVLALYVVTSSLRLLTQVKAMMAKGARQDEIAQTLKKNPYIAKLAMQHARNYSHESLQKALVDLAVLAITSRSGGGDKGWKWSRLEEIIIALVGRD